jgi:SAM-dependent methyltransferase
MASGDRKRGGRQLYRVASKGKQDGMQGFKRRRVYCLWIDWMLLRGMTYYPDILDACCGGRAFWFDKHNPDVLFIDKRTMPPEVVGNGVHARVRSCQPDRVMGFRNMDIPDETFRLVVFDPPHLFVGENSYMAKCYGSLDRQTWMDDIQKGFSECFRVLKPSGILIFKWNECDIPLRNILRCTSQKPLFGHPSGKAQKTHWVCFMKKGVEKE